MIAEDVGVIEGAGPKLRVVAGLGEDGVEVVLWRFGGGERLKEMEMEKD